MKRLFFKDGAGEWRWHLQANNEKIISDSGEGYKSFADAEHGLELVRPLEVFAQNELLKLFIADMLDRERSRDDVDLDWITAMETRVAQLQTFEPDQIVVKED